jgi:Pyrimidine dimer DNA glycosylase
MRLWSLHPSYLDTKGLVACWREGLLARQVLLGKTRGYRNHPQLQRFNTLADPVAALDQYLSAILAEADQRGYSFDHGKITYHPEPISLTVTDGQLAYELAHLRSKLEQRDRAQYVRLAVISSPLPNPIFKVVHGFIEPWEKVSR